jgi:hypothetical protein
MSAPRYAKLLASGRFVAGITRAAMMQMGSSAMATATGRIWTRTELIPQV